MNNRTIRLVKLLLALPATGDAEELATRFGVSLTTLYRDFESLKKAGLPLTYDRLERRYDVSGNSILRPANLTLPEAISLAVIACQLGRTDGIPFLDAAGSAASKLASALPMSIRMELEQVSNFVHIRTFPRKSLADHRRVFEQLLDARRALRVAKVEYRLGVTTQATDLRPYVLLYQTFSWYVMGRSSKHRGIVTIELSRIHSVELKATQYSIPRGFKLESHLRNAWQLIAGQQPKYRVVLRFSQVVAPAVAAVKWHDTQSVNIAKDGTLIFCVTVSTLDEIVWWILGYGDQVEVLRPARLRMFVARRAQNMATLYRND